MSESPSQWRRCSSCKAPIDHGADYWVCNVSTCSRKGNAFVFCSVECWDGHLGIVRHRESWAVEAKAPTRQEWAAQQSGESQKRSAPAKESKAEAPREGKRILPKSSAPAPDESSELPREILIVASKLKNYIRAKSGYNTSDRVLEPVSRLVREICDDAIEQASRDERKTVLDRDFPKTLR